MTELTITYLPLSDLRPDPDNAREHDVQAITSVLARNGLRTAFTVDAGRGVLTRGHGRRLALLSLRQSGSAPPSGVTSDWRVPVIVHDYPSRADAQSDMLADNLASDHGRHDPERLEALLDLVRPFAPDMLDALGFPPFTVPEDVSQALETAVEDELGGVFRGVDPAEDDEGFRITLTYRPEQRVRVLGALARALRYTGTSTYGECVLDLLERID